MIDSIPLMAWPWINQSLTTLIFHRVLPIADPLRPGEQDAAGFDRFMEFLSRNFVVLPLLEAVGRLKSGVLPKRSCCITFDDGYADNLAIALPILEKYSLPSTVFVATGYLDGGRMFNDTIIDAIAHTPRETLDLSSIGLGEHHLSSPEERRDAIAAILEKLKYRIPEQREAEAAQIMERAGCPPLPKDIMLSSTQLQEMSSRGVEIGGHTVKHPILSAIIDEEARSEMAIGKRQLEEIIGKPVRAFAYPNGRPQRDFARRHVAMAREVGFELALTTAMGVGNRDSDMYQLPRFTPWGCSTTRLGMRMMRNAWTGKAAVEC